MTKGKKEESAAESSSYVTDVRVTDVLLGRGSGPNEHRGNVVFRTLVAQRKDEYTRTSNRCQKTKIAKSIVNAITAEKGRFLKQIDATVKNNGESGGGKVWVLANNATIMEKTKQALRQIPKKASITTITNKPLQQQGGGSSGGATGGSESSSSSSPTTTMTPLNNTSKTKASTIQDKERTTTMMTKPKLLLNKSSSSAAAPPTKQEKKDKTAAAVVTKRSSSATAETLR